MYIYFTFLLNFNFLSGIQVYGRNSSAKRTDLKGLFLRTSFNCQHWPLERERICKQRLDEGWFSSRSHHEG
jgi:hypothetical protein